jgi:hypothetical protein
MIEAINDKGTLSAVYAFLSGEKELPKSDWSKRVTAEEDAAILEGLRQESEGEVKSHEEVLAKHRKKYPHLKL